MSQIIRWDPFKEMDALQNRLSSLFAYSPLHRGDKRHENMTVAQWAPLVDITEGDKEYLIKVELPEIKKEDLNVNVENGVLTITGERTCETEDKGRRHHRIERSYGSFARSFAVPDDADNSNVSAEFKDGILLVHLGKSEKAKPKTIEVKVA